jgi:hypothetical protein
MITLDLSFENLYRQYYSCRRNKRNTINALRFEAEQEKNLIDLQQALLNRSYHPGRSVCFFATSPKLREIFAADFRDRVVHHLLVDYLEHIWEPIFIHDSYACRKGKGVHAGVQRLQQFIRQVSCNGSRPAWYLQLDIRNYFMRIDKTVLFKQLAPKIRDETALWLTQLLINHDCTHDYVMRGSPGLRQAIPQHKTLFESGENKGLPIGNLNSQFFANVYLNALDQYVKHELKCKYYLRYCDDFILLADNPEQLTRWQQKITTFLEQSLLLELNPKQLLAPVSNGVNFLGYIVRRDYLLVRRRVVNNFKQKLRDYETKLVKESNGVRCYRFDETLLNKLAAIVSSYLGHFKMANSWNLWQALWKQFGYLAHYFEFDANKWRLMRKYPVPRIKRVCKQYRYFRWRYPKDIVFMHVGKFIEFYDIITPHWLASLGLKAMGWNRRGARYGFPIKQLWQKLSILLLQGHKVLIIGEQVSAFGGVRKRVPDCRFCLA